MNYIVQAMLMFYVVGLCRTDVSTQKTTVQTSNIRTLRFKNRTKKKIRLVQGLRITSQWTGFPTWASNSKRLKYFKFMEKIEHVANNQNCLPSHLLRTLTRYLYRYIPINIFISGWEINFFINSHFHFPSHIRISLTFVTLNGEEVLSILLNQLWSSPFVY